jgi:hypothetical protein
LAVIASASTSICRQVLPLPRAARAITERANSRLGSGTDLGRAATLGSKQEHLAQPLT